jgi:uncharacterized protein (TIGR01777 family)
VRIAVSGASGLLGSSLVPALRSSGHEVARLVRREAEAPDEISWDPSAGRLDPSALEGLDGVVNLSGANVGSRWTAKRKREIVDSRLDTTSLLARTMAEVEPGPRVFVCAGGVDVYGDRADEILTEDSELGQAGFLTEVGKDWEAAAEPARAAGIRVVNFRQGMLLSPAGGALARMLPFFKLGLGGRVANGRQWWSWVSLEDASRAYLFALEGDLSGPVNLVSPEPATSERFAKALGRTLGRPTIFFLPTIGVKTLWGEMGESVLLESQRVLPAKLLDAGFTFRYPNLDAALARALAD